MPIFLLSTVSGLLSGLVVGSELKKSKKVEVRVPGITLKNEKK